MIEMSVAAAGLDPEAKQPMLILTDRHGMRVLPILLGVDEPNVISLAMRESTSNPPPDNMLLRTIQELGYRVSSVMLQRDNDHSCSARVQLSPMAVARQMGARDISIRCPVHDGAVVAVRSHLPILVPEDIIFEGSLPADPKQYREDTDRFHDFVDGLKATDFQPSRS